MLAVLLAALESDTDRQKFIEIYEKYHVQMERTAMRILKEQSDVEDAVQNAFMQMIRHFEKIFEIPCEELPFWIISIVKNEARGILRYIWVHGAGRSIYAVAENIPLCVGIEDAPWLHG